MISLLTGVPGSGKSLHAVSELLLPMQNSEIEFDGKKVKRILYTNIKNLLLDHVLIDKDDLLKWPEWVKPGDLICFDEVQEVWRPRSMGSAAPDSIAKLETHRHMGVDFVLITQHPMLLDQNIRRLVGRHLHVRRVANMALAVVYEWDHASNPSMVKSAITTRPWRYPKSAYKLYKSADAHTKQPRRLPFALLVVCLALMGLVYGGWSLQGRYTERFATKPPVSSVTATTKPALVGGMPINQVSALPPGPVPFVPGQNASSVYERPLGCIAVRTRCACYDQSGYTVPMPEKQCREQTVSMAYIIRDNSRPLFEKGTSPSASLTDKHPLGGDPLGEGNALKSVPMQSGPVANGVNPQTYSGKV